MTVTRMGFAPELTDGRGLYDTRAGVGNRGENPMGVIVQKYGGSSVATPEKLKQVAARIVDTRRMGHRVVVVVSAMGNTTNELLALARSVSANPHRRELDMLVTTGERISMALLSMAIVDLGHPAVSFTGSQSGIITSDHHTNARILRITPTRIQQALERDEIVIVAGFQGVSERREITSLGRGGSDTTAVALAAALDADYAEICSGVDGVYSADPRVVPEARRLDTLSYEEMQVLADAGAKVLNAEAVEWARRHGIEVRCVATAGDAAVGTSIRAQDGKDHPRVVGVTAHPGLFLLEPEAPGEPPPNELEATLAAHGAAESEVWRMPSGWSALVPRQNVHGLEAFREAVSSLGRVRLREDLALVTIAGRSLSAPPGHARLAARALAVAGITVRGRLVDAGRAAFLVDAGAATDAVRVLHAELLEGEAGLAAPGTVR
jgi:aspartate kinase